MSALRVEQDYLVIAILQLGQAVGHCCSFGRSIGLCRDCLGLKFGDAP